jgi:hypothetical protein
MSQNRNSGVESDAGAIYDATKAAQDLEKEKSKSKSKSKSKVKFGPEMSDTNNGESGETDDERNASGFAPPSSKNRTKKRQHVAGSGVTPEPKEARYTSAYKDGNKIERTPAQIKATAMALEDRAKRKKSGLMAAVVTHAQGGVVWVAATLATAAMVGATMVVCRMAEGAEVAAMAVAMAAISMVTNLIH